MKHFHLLATLALSLSTASFIQPTPGQAATSSPYQIIDRQTANSGTIDVQVIPGRATSIDFSQTDEIITYVLLADPSQVVYTPSAAIGKAKSLYLRAIQPLKFPGTTTAAITNLRIETVDQRGQQRSYNFNIIPSKGNTTYLGVRIAPNAISQPVIAGSRQITADDLEIGLRLAIARGYTQANDPIVTKVQHMIVLMRNGTPVRVAAQSAQVSIPVITALAKIATERLTPTTSSTTTLGAQIRNLPESQRAIILQPKFLQKSLIV